MIASLVVVPCGHTVTAIQRTHDVEMTKHWRHMDVSAALSRRPVPAGSAAVTLIVRSYVEPFLLDIAPMLRLYMRGTLCKSMYI